MSTGPLPLADLATDLVFRSRAGTALTHTSSLDTGLLADAGVTLPQLQALAGHASPTTSQRYYTRISDRALRHVTASPPWET